MKLLKSQKAVHVSKITVKKITVSALKMDYLVLLFANVLTAIIKRSIFLQTKLADWPIDPVGKNRKSCSKLKIIVLLKSVRNFHLSRKMSN